MNDIALGNSLPSDDDDDFFFFLGPSSSEENDSCEKRALDGNTYKEHDVVNREQ